MSKASSPKPGFDIFNPTTQAPSKAKGHPTLNAPQAIRNKVDRFVSESDQLKALEGSVAILREELRSDAFPFWVESCGSKFTPSVLIPGTKDSNVMVTFKNDRRIVLDAANSEPAKELLGDAFNDLFEDKKSITMKLGSIPDTFVNNDLVDAVEAMGTGRSTAAKMETLRSHIPTGQVAFVNELLGLIASLNLVPSDVVQVSLNVDAIPEEQQGDFYQGVCDLATKLGLDPATIASATMRTVPVADFNEKSATLLTKEQQVSLDTFYKRPSMVKAK